MAQCPHCGGDYAPEPGQEFCDNCGNRLTVASTFDDPVSIAGLLSSPQPNGGAGGDPVAAANVKVTAVGEGITAGGNVSIQQNVQLEFCAAGHEQLFGDRTLYRCPRCHKYPVCDHHFDETRTLCSACTDEPKVVCGVCNDRLPASQTFTCRRCRRIVGADHRDPKREEWCTECSARWAGVVDAIERDEVGISMDGTVVGRDDVELRNKVLTTKDGKPVATIKENIWYAGPKQWYRVKSRLLQQEEQAMHRFYPSFSMDTTSIGDLHWQGVLTTWAGNEYEVQVRYPDAFPFRPPKAYVVSPKIQESRHIYPDGHLCLFHKDDKSWEPKTTAATVMSWVSLWLHCYEVWLETGDWPRREHDEMVITTDY